MFDCKNLYAEERLTGLRLSGFGIVLFLTM